MLLTMTTSNRLQYWMQTVKSLKEVLNIEAFIDRCVIIDDGSKESDIVMMQSTMAELFPSIDTSFSRNEITDCRRYRVIRLWSNVVSKEMSGSLVFHCEDDWVFFDNPLPWANDLMEKYDWIGQACFVSWFKNAAGKHVTSFGGFWIPHFGNSSWYLPTKFTWNPSLIRADSVRRTACELGHTQNFEGKYGSQWMLGGYSTVHPLRDYCSHIGTQTAFDINKSQR